MGRIMYLILPSKVKISVFFPMGLPTIQDADGMANSVDPDQTAPLGAV